MPQDQTGLIPPPSSGSGLSLGGESGGAGGGFASWSSGKKVAVIGGGFAVLALGVYLYSKNKAASTSTTTAPQVIAPSTTSTPSGTTGYSSGSSLGTGGGNFSGQGPLATELAAIKTDLDALIANGAPVNNGGVGSAQSGGSTLGGPGSTLQTYIPNPAPTGNQVGPYTVTTPASAGAILSQYQADQNSGSVPTPQAGSPAWNAVTVANNTVDLSSAQGILGLSGTPFASLTPAQQQQVINTAAL